jgi:peptidoglycan-N-acetylglucosamine deacetylase
MTEQYPWPDERRSALCVTFDFDGESPLLWRSRNDPPAGVSELEQRRYGPRRGVWHVLEMLAGTGVTATFFVPGYIVDRYPEAVRAVHDGGHEIALHGWCHEPPTTIGPDELRETLTRAIGAIGDLTGVPPVGYRSPSFQMTPAAFEVLTALGLRYDSSVMGDDRPYRIGDLVEVPVDWSTDDAIFYRYTGGEARPPLGADALFTAWRSELDGARAAGTLVNLTMHPWLSGRPARVLRVRDLIEYAQAAGDVWIGPVGELAARHRDGDLPGIAVGTAATGWPA